MGMLSKARSASLILWIAWFPAACGEDIDCDEGPCPQERGDSGPADREAIATAQQWVDVVESCRPNNVAGGITAPLIPGDPRCPAEIAVRVLDDGRLSELGGQDCEFLGFGRDGPTESPACFQAHLCGDCEFLMGINKNQTDGQSQWEIGGMGEACGAHLGCAYILGPAEGAF